MKANILLSSFKWHYSLTPNLYEHIFLIPLRMLIFSYVIYIFAILGSQKRHFLLFLTPKSAPIHYMLWSNPAFSFSNHISSSFLCPQGSHCIWFLECDTDPLFSTLDVRSSKQQHSVCGVLLC